MQLGNSCFSRIFLLQSNLEFSSIAELVEPGLIREYGQPPLSKPPSAIAGGKVMATLTLFILQQRFPSWFSYW